MRTKRETLRMRALLVALTATSCCCMMTAASGSTSNPTSTTSVINNLLRRGDQAPPTTTTTNAATTTTTAHERFQPATTNNLNAGSVTQPENPTTTTTTTTIETKVPSISISTPISPSATPITTTTLITTTQSPAATAQKPASQPLAQQPATTTSQFQYVRPATSVSSVTTVAPVTPVTSQLEPPACQHNNRTYALGQTWNDDCLQVCQCVLSDGGPSGSEQPPPPLAISACKTRCPTYHDPPGDNCKLIRSKRDECCLEWSCDLEAKFAPAASTSTGDSLSSTTVMQTERGELSMSTTEIRMPTTTTTTTTAAPVTTTAQPTTTTTPRPPSSRPQTVTTTTGQQHTPSLRQRTGNQQPQLTPALVATTTLRPQQPAVTITTSTANRRPSAAAALGARAPKQVSASNHPSARPSRPADWTRSVDGSMPVQPNNLIEPVPQVDPTTLDLCISHAESDSIQRVVNTNWLVPQCNRTCRCVFRNEPLDGYTDIARFVSINLKADSLPTEIRCGLPVGCPAQIPPMPSVECPKPQLRWPKALLLDQTSCACPELVCTNQSAPTTTTTTTTTTQSTQATQILHAPTTTTTTAPVAAAAAAAGCKQPGSDRLMAPGETFNDECHSICMCTADSNLRCEQLNCPSEPPSDHLCVAWAQVEPDLRGNSTETHTKCCPEFVCKVPVPTLESLNVTTPPDAGDRLIVVNDGGKLLTTPPTAATEFKSCTFMGKQYAHDERLPEQIQGNPRDNQDIQSNASSDTCERVCTCLNGAIVCQPAPCPSLADSPPVDLECPASLAYQLIEDCCPKWVCPGGNDPPGLQDIQIQKVNSTTVEIVVRLPESADKQPGTLVLNYTNLPLTNPDSLNEEPPAYAHWVRRPTKTLNGTLSALIKYHLTGLRPASRYWVRFSVLFEKGSDGGDLLPPEEPLESTTHSFTMPAVDDFDLSSTVSTTTTTSTTLAQSQSQSQPSPPPTRTIIPKSSTTRAPVLSATSSTSTTANSTTTTTTTTTSTTTTARPTTTPSTAATNDDDSSRQVLFTKPAVDDAAVPSTTGVPCTHDDNSIDAPASNGINISPHQPWVEYLRHHVQNAPIQRYAWHLLVAFSVMTILFTIVSYLYFKKSSRMIAPITSPYHHHHHAFHQQSAYDNPTFTTKLVSYNANQPRVLLVDESYQNLDNLAKQKNMEVDKSSPLHHHNHHHKNNNNNNNNNNGNHTTTMIQHQNGRQHLI